MRTGVVVAAGHFTRASNVMNVISFAFFNPSILLYSMVKHLITIVPRHYFVGRVRNWPGAVIIRGETIGSFEILIGPLEEILRGLFEIVMMERSSILLVKLLADRVFSNRIS